MFLVNIECSVSVLADLRTILSPDELARANGFRFDRDRRRMIASRGTLRRLLGHYLERMPAELSFDYNEHGKPSVESEGDLRFNVSHAADWALYAFSTGRAVGIDIEQARAERDLLAIADRYFSPTELSALGGLPEAVRTDAFYRGWVCKEAWLKARGLGLAAGLARFSVEVDPAKPAALLSVDNEPDEAGRWRLYDIPSPDGFRAALAVEGSPSEITCVRMPGKHLLAGHLI